MPPDLAAKSDRFEPMEWPRGMLVLRWNRHRNEPAWVVGEQRQFIRLANGLPEPSPCARGDSISGECFRISSIVILGTDILRSTCFSSILGGLRTSPPAIVFAICNQVHNLSNYCSIANSYKPTS